MTDIDDELMKTNYTYPDINDDDLQYKVYKKREFYYNKIPERPDIKSYNDLKEYRDSICAGEPSLFDYQSLLGNIINPNTPYKGMIVFHGLGTGKCVAPNSKILIKNKGLQEILTIEEIWNSNARNIIKELDGGEWAQPLSQLETFSYTGSYIEFKKITKLYREYINGLIKKYILEDGTIIEASLIHKFLSVQNVWSNQLKSGDYILKHDRNEIKQCKIISVELIKYSGYIYDLEIDTYHNYIVNNCITHNTCAGVAIGEKFKSQVQKYNTKIIVLVPGPLIKESWKHHLIKCTGETYLKKIDKSSYIDHAEIDRLKKNAIAQALQYYKFMSYKSFYKRVLGEKIIERKEDGKVSYRKTEEGEFERDLSVERIYNLNNTLIIVDEAHNLTGNAYGEALKIIIERSINLKVVLMSATPMKNLADDIIDLLNFIRPINSPIERELIFSAEKNYEMKIKPGGIEYFKKMANGYISHVRGSNPLVFAKRVDKGEKPEGLLFTKVTRCAMSKFQRALYDKTKVESEDALDRKAEAVANFVFPCLTPDKKDITGCSGNEGLYLIKNQLKVYGDILNKKIGLEFFNSDKETDLIHLTPDGTSVTGRILKSPYLKIFSTKFYTALKKLNRLVCGKKGPKTAFVYSNLVKVGIDVFEQVLIQNGYIEYQEDAASYQIKPDTICYYCGKENQFHSKQNKVDENNSASSSEYNKVECKEHQFFPATYITVTGKSGDDTADVIPEEKKKILDDVFSNYNNREGKFLKFVLGSKVMNEGISLHNTAEVHILDVYYNFGRVDQVIGRAIRWCSHYKQMSETNQYPYVNVYKYVVALESGLSAEEELYRKAEKKYLLIKQVERAMKEIAIDCPLNLQANIFKEEIEKYKDCDKNGKECPALCDYTSCNFKCDNIKLNTEFYDPQRMIYKNINKDKLDITTFSTGLAETEIDFCKKKIKEMYILNFMYTLGDILTWVKNSYPEEKSDLFDEFFVFKALDELIPTTENAINSYRDTIIDKNNRSGYLIFVDKYYIFQPFDQNEDVPIYYRTKYIRPINQSISLYNYLKSHSDFAATDKIQQSEEQDVKEDKEYDFASIMYYYDNREENKYVGIIEKDLSRKKNIETGLEQDVFKIREKRSKILEKKRGTGIPSLKGAVCTTKDKPYLEKVAKELNIKFDDNSRLGICHNIRDKMLELEKYSTTADKNKKTYIMIPANHVTYKFPFNLEDRTEMIKQQIKTNISSKININIKKIPKDKHFYFTLSIPLDESSKDYKTDLDKIIENNSGKFDKNSWVIIID
jgi:superfamily II DNA or RNA helicase